MRLLRGDAALGLRYGTDPDPGLVSDIIHHERLVAVCPPEHPLAAGGTDFAAAAALPRRIPHQLPGPMAGRRAAAPDPQTLQRVLDGLRRL